MFQSSLGIVFRVLCVYVDFREERLWLSSNLKRSVIREKDLPSSCPDSIDLGKANEPNHMELGRKDDAKVHKMFLDHTGKW